MQMYRSIHNEMISVSINAPLEVGGIIGGYDHIVKKYYMDEGISSDSVCRYTPNVSLLNTVISQWESIGVQFMGMYHTHFNDVQTLSEGDILYIRKILRNMPIEIELLYFPLIVFPSKTMVCYKAERKNNIEISKDNLVLV